MRAITNGFGDAYTSPADATTIIFVGLARCNSIDKIFQICIHYSWEHDMIRSYVVSESLQSNGVTLRVLWTQHSARSTVERLSLAARCRHCKTQALMFWHALGTRRDVCGPACVGAWHVSLNAASCTIDTCMRRRSPGLQTMQEVAGEYSNAESHCRCILHHVYIGNLVPLVLSNRCLETSHRRVATITSV